MIKIQSGVVSKLLTVRLWVSLFILTAFIPVFIIFKLTSYGIIQALTLLIFLIIIYYFVSRCYSVNLRANHIIGRDVFNKGSLCFDWNYLSRFRSWNLGVCSLLYFQYRIDGKNGHMFSFASNTSVKLNCLSELKKKVK
jgi:hypothetical protein